MRTIILKVLVLNSDILISNTRGIIYGNFILQIMNKETSATEWVFYPLKNVYIKEYALKEILYELQLLNNQNCKRLITKPCFEIK